MFLIPATKLSYVVTATLLTCLPRPAIHVDKLALYARANFFVLHAKQGLRLKRVMSPVAEHGAQLSTMEMLLAQDQQIYILKGMHATRTPHKAARHQVPLQPAMPPLL